MESTKYLSKGALGFGVGSILAVLFLGPFGLIITFVAILFSILSLLQKNENKTTREKSELIVAIALSLISIIFGFIVYL